MATLQRDSTKQLTSNKKVQQRKQTWSLPLWLFYPLSLVLLLVVWQLVVVVGDYERFILPTPLDVARQFGIVLADGRLIQHTAITFAEVVPGLLIGVSLATPIGYMLAKSPLAERLISPYLIASQAVPVIAVAPLIMIWIESVFWSRVAVAVLVVFFPILVNVIAGLRSVPRPLYDVMRALKASRWQTFTKLELPAALPTLLAGLKVGATLSVIGTIVGEFVQPRSLGLGFLVNAARYQFKTDLVFVVILTLGLMSLTLYGLVALLERYLLRWQRES